MCLSFLVSKSEFDEIFGRIRERSLPYWADPAKTQAGKINLALLAIWVLLFAGRYNF